MMDVGALPHGRVTVDSAPIIYFLEGHPRFASRYAPFFQRAEAGDYQLVIATVTLAEVSRGLCALATRRWHSSTGSR